MRVSFFSPIYAGSTPHSSEKWKILRGTTQFFNFGQKSFELLHFTGTNRIEAGEKIASKPGWFGVAMRVAALFTVVIPLLMLMGALIYKARNRFEVCARPSNFDPVSKEVLNLLLSYMDSTCLRFGATSKAHLELVDKDLSLKAHRVLPMLERSYNMADNFDHANKCSVLADVAKGFFLVDKARAISVVKESITAANAIRFTNVPYHIPDSKKLYDILALLCALDDAEVANEAVESVWTFTDDVCRYQAVAAVIEKLAVKKPSLAGDLAKKAIAEINSVNTDLHRAKCITAIAEIVPTLEPDTALELAEEALIIAKTLNEYKYELLAIIAKSLVVSNPERSLEIIDDAIAEANNIANITHKSNALAFLVESLAVLDARKAEGVANTIPDSANKSWALSSIVIALVNEKPQKALSLTRSISNEDKVAKSKALAAYIKALAPTDPNKALDVFNNWEHWPYSYGNYREAWLSGLRYFSDEKSKARTAIAKALVLSDSSKAFSVAKDSTGATLEVIKILGAFNPQKALESLNTKIGYRSTDCLVATAKVLAASDPTNAKKLIEEAMQWNEYAMRWSNWHDDMIDPLLVLDPGLAIKAINKQDYYSAYNKARSLAKFAYCYLAKSLT